jgi:hypothetical protein
LLEEFAAHGEHDAVGQLAGGGAGAVGAHGQLQAGGGQLAFVAEQPQP